VPLDQLESLAHLVRLDLTSDFLEVHELGDVRMGEDMMAAPDPALTKAEACQQVYEVGQRNVSRAIQDSEQEPSSIHACQAGRT
jgi:hypothetical protein